METAGLGKVTHDLKDHTNVVEQLCWQSENTDILASVSSDKTLKVWDMRASKKNIKTVSSKSMNFNIAWSPDGRIIAAGNNDSVTFYDYPSLNVIKQIKLDKEINEFSWDLSGQLFFITTS